ncbi:DUF397 domain-containing protein [Streptomyces catenulae]|uniref:DUF397 domain-containing protein n=1 Tax=Streptomyces catenulae TaxID=66875 RepID=A0ABV2Z2J5_9ACTN|nr:DUF397 domain-containing protein [Streptomyces catenulae]
MELGNGVSASKIADARWFKSAASKTENCVEVTGLPSGDVAFRNSRFPSGPALLFTADEMKAFINGVKCAEFDHLVDSSM